jgi:hypothetical protein
MGRSVSTPCNAQAIAYQHLDDDDDEGGNHFRWWLEDMQQTIAEIWPSFTPCDQWLGREDHAIMENNLAYAGVSEYCGMIALWLVPKEESRHGQHILALAEQFISRIAPRFMAQFNHYRKLGTFSNGDAVFEKAA